MDLKKRKQLLLFIFGYTAMDDDPNDNVASHARGHSLRSLLSRMMMRRLADSIEIHPLYSHNRSSQSEKQTEMSFNRRRLAAEVQIQIARI